MTKPYPKKRLLAELVSTSVKPFPVRHEPRGPLVRFSRVNPPAQRRMEARQSAESGANHARHHVARKTQS